MTRLWLRMQALHDVKQARLGGALGSLRAYAVAPATGAARPRRIAACPRAMLVLRDNLRHRAQHRAGLPPRDRPRARGNHHRQRLFVPGGKMRRALVSAARRGVKVRLLLQGRYEYFMQYYAARPIYGALLRAGVEIHEYSPSFLHAKVAVIDGHWATVGSSNLDPLSLLLAREANVVVEDVAFAGAAARAAWSGRSTQAGRVMNPDEYSHRPLRQRFMEGVALALMRLALMIQGKKYL